MEAVDHLPPVNDTRSVPTATCEDCGVAFTDVAAFRALTLEDILAFDDHTKLEIRSCPCGASLGIWINRDGEVVQGVRDDEGSDEEGPV